MGHTRIGASVSFTGCLVAQPTNRVGPSVGWCLSTRQETSPSRYKMKILFLLTVFVAATHSQIQFGDSSSSSSSSSKASSDASSQSAVSEDGDGVNTRFFGLFKPKPKPKPVWRPKPQQQSYRPTNSCGRRRRQAVEEEGEASPNTRLRLFDHLVLEVLICRNRIKYTFQVLFQAKAETEASVGWVHLW